VVWRTEGHHRIDEFVAVQLFDVPPRVESSHRVTDEVDAFVVFVVRRLYLLADEFCVVTRRPHRRAGNDALVDGVYLVGDETETLEVLRHPVPPRCVPRVQEAVDEDDRLHTS
jgi:hypothetical protein